MSVLGVFALVAVTTLAQQPRAGYVHPTVVAPGATTEVTLGGYDYTPDVEFLALDPRIQLEALGPPGDFVLHPPPYWFGSRGRMAASPIPREVTARIQVPEGFASGSVAWQVSTANGGTAARRFLVSSLPIVPESRRRSDAQTIASLPVMIPGRFRLHAEVDRYVFTAPSRGPVTLRLYTRQLGVDINATVKVVDEHQRVVLDVADTEGLDLAETFAVEQGARYTIHVSEIDFRGNRAYVYALELTSGPRVVATLPSALKRGGCHDVEFVGYGLGDDPAVLTSVMRHIDVSSSDISGEAVDVFEYKLDLQAAKTRVAFSLSDLDELVARESDELFLEAPVAVTGRIDAPGDEDRYVLDLRKDEAWRVSVQARTLGSPVDASLRVLDASGKELATSDDVAGTLDCLLDFTAPADGRYAVVVSERSASTTRGASEEASAAAIYRLVVEPLRPDFTLSVGQTLNASVGGQTKIKVRATRIGGHKKPIHLAMTGLPEGITAASTTIADSASEAQISLTVAGDTGTDVAHVQVVGISKVDGKEVARVATATLSGNLCPRDPARETTSRLLLTPTLPSPVKIEVVDRDRQRSVPRGSTQPVPIIVTRDEGYEGQVHILMGAGQSRRRQGSYASTVEVPAGRDRVEFPCFLTEWIETDRTTRFNPIAMAKVKDAKGHDRYLLSKTRQRITFIVHGALLKMTHDDSEVEASLGGTLELEAMVRRVPLFRESVKVEVLFPEDVRKQFEVSVLDVPPDRDLARVRVPVPTDASLVGEHEVTIVGTALRDGKWPVVSQVVVPVRIRP